MLDTGAEPNLIKARSVHPDTQILRKNKLHIVSITDGFAKSFGSVQVSLRHLLRMDITSDNFPIFQKEILETYFFKDNAPVQISDTMCRDCHKMAITIPCTRQDAVLISVRTAKVFYIKIKNPDGISLVRRSKRGKYTNEEPWRKSVY